MKQQQILSPLQKTIRFYRTIQAGDIALFNYIQEGIFFLGQTKVGKTSSCHCLCGSPLRAQMVNGVLVYRPSGNRYPAKVGNLTDSETQIPNIFKTQVCNPQTMQVIKTVVLDQPGYGDTYGFHRTFSNGYFHYRSFSKVGKVKFVLVFSQKELQDDAGNFQKTIKHFFNSFKNYQSIKLQIEAATSFLVTKVDNTLNTPQLLINKLIFLRANIVKNMGKQKKYAQSLITNIIDNNKAYFIPKPTQVGLSTTENVILQNIYFNSSFWQRPLEQKSNIFVSMQQINFSVAKQVMAKLQDDNQQTYQEDFNYFMKFTQQRVNDIITQNRGSLTNIIRQLLEDAQRSNQSNEFLDLMKELNSKYYQFNPQYKQQRKKREFDLFKEEVSQSTSSLKQNEAIFSKKTKANQNTYFIKKFNVIQFVKILESNYELKSAYIERNIQEMEQISATFKKIFRKFTILGITKDHQEIILRYSYIVQRLIEEYKIIILILFKDKQALTLFNSAENLSFSEDLCRSVTDRFFTQTVGEIDVLKLKIAFMEKFNFNELTSINDQIIQFFQDLTDPQNVLVNQKQEVYEKAQSEKRKDKLILLKVSQLLKKYYKEIFELQTPPTKEQMLKIVKKLCQYRNKLYWQMNYETEMINKKEIITHILTITRLLANVFRKLNKMEEVKDCYISINDAKALFFVYEEELNSKVGQKQQRDHLLKYGKTAINYDRKELAKDCFQRAYSLSEECDEVLEVSRRIASLDYQEEEECMYIQNMRAGKFCLDLSPRVKSWLQSK